MCPIIHMLLCWMAKPKPRAAYVIPPCRTLCAWLPIQLWLCVCVTVVCLNIPASRSRDWRVVIVYIYISYSHILHTHTHTDSRKWVHNAAQHTYPLTNTHPYTHAHMCVCVCDCEVVHGHGIRFSVLPQDRPTIHEISTCCSSPLPLLSLSRCQHCHVYATQRYWICASPSWNQNNLIVRCYMSRLVDNIFIENHQIVIPSRGPEVSLVGKWKFSYHIFENFHRAFCCKKGP